MTDGGAGNRRGPGLRRTTWGEIAGPFLVVGAVVYLLLRFTYHDIPPLQWTVSVPLGALAVAEFIAARRVRAAVRHDPDAKPIAAILIARCVALGRSSALVAAAVAGGAAGLLVRLVPDVSMITAAAHDTTVAAVLVAVSGALTVAGLLLERAGIDPNHDQRNRVEQRP